ncbi:MAG: radical SAM family heme chaperone HemW [Lachnospiraceae bacterium]|nr:radical SAM family heme chaperone HemW [Lachnospiraceae bacterium]
MSAGIYIHIPFCKQKCLYCDFVSAKGCDRDMELYEEALLKEIESTEIDEPVDSVFFGGGTPSVYKVEYIEEILKIIFRKYNIVKDKAEITIEVNPGTVDYDKLKRYRAAGINRISIGLQSADNEELKLLGRIHTYGKFVETYTEARRAGFNNINIDLMSAIPYQTVNSFMETLKKVVKLNPEHISAYSLIIEEGTPFYNKYGENGEFSDAIPSEETDREMYHMTKTFLKENGYERYEISNYAKKGYECKHNIKYWSRDNYYGFGVAAASLVNNLRYSNISDGDKYIDILLGGKSNRTGIEGINNTNINEINADGISHTNINEINAERINYTNINQINVDGRSHTNIDEIRDEISEVNKDEQIEEFMFLGLRKMEGISLKEFERLFGKTLREEYGEIPDRLISEGLCEEVIREGDKDIEDIRKYVDKNISKEIYGGIKDNEGYFRLTERGIDISNSVFVKFMK